MTCFETWEREKEPTLVSSKPEIKTRVPTAAISTQNVAVSGRPGARLEPTGFAALPSKARCS